MIQRQSLLAIVLSLALPALALAQPKGDPAKGAALSVACQACHVSANPDAPTPRLAGQRPAYLTRQLRAFRAGDRKHDLMSVIAGQLSDDDIANVVAYWASQPMGSDSTPSDATAFRKQKMTFPKAFPKGFAVYAESYDEKAQTVARSYANQVAMAAARAGKALPVGSVILVANYKAKLDAQGKAVRNAAGGYEVAEAMSYSGMEARKGWSKDVPALLSNEHWGYGLFGGDQTPKPEASQAACLACHKAKASESYMFTEKQLRDAARGSGAASSR